MKYIYIGMVFIFVALNFAFWSSAETRQKLEVVKYKHSTESAAYSACRAIQYEDKEALLKIGNGFGEGATSSLNIPLDEEQGLKNFDEILLKSLGIKDGIRKDEVLRNIKLQVWVEFDGFRIKYGKENWSPKEYYSCEWDGKKYNLNFSDYLVRCSDGEWIYWDGVSGMTKDKIRNKINATISNGINDSLLKCEVGFAGENKRHLTFLSDFTGNSSSLCSFNGPGFLAIIDGVKIPSLNIPNRNNLNIYSVGGSDLYR